MSYSAMVSRILWGVLLLVVVLGFLFMGILAFSDQSDGLQQLFNRQQQRTHAPQNIIKI